MMAITRDYLEPTDTKDATETQFIDQLLEGWAKWARNTGVDQRATTFADLWPTPTIIELGTYVLELTDENFCLIDHKVAHLPRRLHAIVYVEYMGSEPTAKQRAARMGLAYLAYRQRLHAAQWALYAALSEYLEALRHNASVTAIKHAARFRTKDLV
jgi:hypothetical protein